MVLTVIWILDTWLPFMFHISSNKNASVISREAHIAVGSVVIGHLIREGIGCKIETSNQLLQLQYKEDILLTPLMEPDIVNS